MGLVSHVRASSAKMVSVQILHTETYLRTFLAREGPEKDSGSFTAGAGSSSDLG